MNKSLIMIMALCLTLVSCGKKTENNDADNGSPTIQPLNATEETVELHEAIDKNDLHAFLNLIGSADLTAAYQGLTPIVRVVKARYNDPSNNDMAINLLAQGVSVNSQDAEGTSILTISIVKRKAILINKLLASENEDIDVNVANNFGETALLAAIRNKDERLALKLIELGANISISNLSGISIYDAAKTLNLKKVVDKIITELALADDMPNTHALYSAMELGDEVALSRLLRKFPLSEYKGTQDILGTLVLNPVQGTAANMANLLIDHGANEKGHYPFGPTPLMRAAMMNNYSLVKVFIKRIPQTIQLTDSSGSSALILSVRKGSDTATQILVNSGKTNVRRKDSSGKSALVWAILSNNDRIVKLLLDSGADKKTQDSSNRSACWHSGEYRSNKISTIVNASAKETQERKMKAIRKLLGCW